MPVNRLSRVLLLKYLFEELNCCALIIATILASDCAPEWIVTDVVKVVYEYVISYILEF